MNSSHENSAPAAPAPRRRTSFTLGHGRDNFDGDRIGCTPPSVDQQRLGVRRDLLGLGKDRLDRVGVLVARDDLPRQSEH